MSHLLENTVRREQVKLLRFEKFLRQIAPIVIATGLTAASAEAAHAQLAALDNAKSIFVKLEGGAATSHVIIEAEASLLALISNLSMSVSADVRKSSMLAIMETVDLAHQTAQDASYRQGVRLLGEKRSAGKVDGGTPKRSGNADWLAKNLVDGGTPKTSDNADWLRSTFGL